MLSPDPRLLIYDTPPSLAVASSEPPNLSRPPSLSERASVPNMSDVDDELLALAGGDVSSDEDDAAMDMSRDQSRSPSRSRSPTPPRKDSASKGGVAAKKGNAAKGRNRGSRSDQESDEEGEA